MLISKINRFANLLKSNISRWALRSEDWSMGVISFAIPKATLKINHFFMQTTIIKFLKKLCSFKPIDDNLFRFYFQLKDCRVMVNDYFLHNNLFKNIRQGMNWIFETVTALTSDLFCGLKISKLDVNQFKLSEYNFLIIQEFNFLAE